MKAALIEVMTIGDDIIMRVHLSDSDEPLDIELDPADAVSLGHSLLAFDLEDTDPQ